MSDQPTAAIVYNPTKVDLDALRRLVADQEAASGWAPSLWLSTSETDDGDAAARRALDAEVDLVIAAGGDGTVRAVAETLTGTGTSMALLPRGTGNLLAGNLGLDSDDEADHVRIAFEGRDTPIDVGRIAVIRPNGDRDEKVFVVMAGLGLDVDMIVNTNEALKAKVGWLAYVGGIVAALRRPTSADFRYAIDDGERRHLHANSVIVGNCGHLRGGIVLFPDARLDDGLLDLAIMDPTTTADWWVLIKKVLWDHRRADTADQASDDGPVSFAQGESDSFSLRHPVEMELDGDSIGEARAFTAWAEPGGLMIRRDRRHVAR